MFTTCFVFLHSTVNSMRVVIFLYFIHCYTQVFQQNLMQHWYSNTYGINHVDGDLEFQWYDQWEQPHEESVPSWQAESPEMWGPWVWLRNHQLCLISL